jgi:hypothetical protein
MIVIMTAKKLKEICDDCYGRGVAKGYEFGYRAAKSEKNNRGFIIGAKVDKQIEEILKGEDQQDR